MLKIFHGIIGLSNRRIEKLFLIVSAIMFICLITGNYESVIYLLLLGILYTLLLVIIFSQRPSPSFVIFGLLYTTAALIFPVVFSHAYYYDGSDIIYHTNAIISVIDSGSLSQILLVIIGHFQVFTYMWVLGLSSLIFKHIQHCMFSLLLHI